MESGITLDLQIVLTVHNVSAWLGHLMRFNFYDKYVTLIMAWWLSSYPRCPAEGRWFCRLGRASLCGFVMCGRDIDNAT